MNAIFWIAVLIIFVLIYLDDKTKKEKKAIGALLIAIGIFFILPIPDYTDFILFPVFSTLSGLTTIKENVIPYLIFTGVLGLGIIWVGLKLANKDFKYVKKKLIKTLK